jgi:hypothetical protein
MNTLRESYFKAGKKEKGAILDRYCASTGEDRKYAIKKFRYTVKVKKPEERKVRGKTYDGRVTAPLADLWRIFDRPCGARLMPMVRDELARLRALKEVSCTDETARLLVRMSPASIDRALAHTKEVEHAEKRYGTKQDRTLLSTVPMKTSADLDRTVPGMVQIDCVEHCGTHAGGEYALSLTTVDVLFGWWEGDAFLGKGQARTLRAIDAVRAHSPVPWVEMHPDNGSNILNWHVYRYALDHGIALSRSRSYRKNDNCWVEQKNDTHVRNMVGYLRYDTDEEVAILHDLYRNELCLYKNFCQPVMKLVEKVRDGGSVHRRYDTPATPYQRIMADERIDVDTKQRLTEVYRSLNPAHLKRTIDRKLHLLYRAYQKKTGRTSVDAGPVLSTVSVSKQLIER